MSSPKSFYLGNEQRLQQRRDSDPVFTDRSPFSLSSNVELPATQGGAFGSSSMASSKTSAHESRDQQLASIQARLTRLTARLQSIQMDSDRGYESVRTDLIAELNQLREAHQQILAQPIFNQMPIQTAVPPTASTLSSGMQPWMPAAQPHFFSASPSLQSMPAPQAHFFQASPSLQSMPFPQSAALKNWASYSRYTPGAPGPQLSPQPPPSPQPSQPQGQPWQSMSFPLSAVLGKGRSFSIYTPGARRPQLPPQPQGQIPSPQPPRSSSPQLSRLPSRPPSPQPQSQIWQQMPSSQFQDQSLPQMPFTSSGEPSYSESVAVSVPGALGGSPLPLPPSNPASLQFQVPPRQQMLSTQTQVPPCPWMTSPHSLALNEVSTYAQENDSSYCDDESFLSHTSPSPLHPFQYSANEFTEDENQNYFFTPIQSCFNNGVGAPALDIAWNPEEHIYDRVADGDGDVGGVDANAPDCDWYLEEDIYDRVTDEEVGDVDVHAPAPAPAVDSTWNPVEHIYASVPFEGEVGGVDANVNAPVGHTVERPYESASTIVGGVNVNTGSGVEQQETVSDSSHENLELGDATIDPGSKAGRKTRQNRLKNLRNLSGQALRTIFGSKLVLPRKEKAQPHAVDPNPQVHGAGLTSSETRASQNATAQQSDDSFPTVLVPTPKLSTRVLKQNKNQRPTKPPPSAPKRPAPPPPTPQSRGVNPLGPAEAVVTGAAPAPASGAMAAVQPLSFGNTAPAADLASLYARTNKKNPEARVPQPQPEDTNLQLNDIDQEFEEEKAPPLPERGQDDTPQNSSGNASQPTTESTHRSVEGAVSDQLPYETTEELAAQHRLPLYTSTGGAANIGRAVASEVAGEEAPPSPLYEEVGLARAQAEDTGIPETPSIGRSAISALGSPLPPLPGEIDASAELASSAAPSGIPVPLPRQKKPATTHGETAIDERSTEKPVATPRRNTVEPNFERAGTGTRRKHPRTPKNNVPRARPSLLPRPLPQLPVIDLSVIGNINEPQGEPGGSPVALAASNEESSGEIKYAELKPRLASASASEGASGLSPNQTLYSEVRADAAPYQLPRPHRRKMAIEKCEYIDNQIQVSLSFPEPTMGIHLSTLFKRKGRTRECFTKKENKFLSYIGISMMEALIASEESLPEGLFRTSGEVKKVDAFYKEFKKARKNGGQLDLELNGAELGSILKFIIKEHFSLADKQAFDQILVENQAILEKSAKMYDGGAQAIDLTELAQIKAILANNLPASFKIVMALFKRLVVDVKTTKMTPEAISKAINYETLIGHKTLIDIPEPASALTAETYKIEQYQTLIRGAINVLIPPPLPQALGDSHQALERLI